MSEPTSLFPRTLETEAPPQVWIITPPRRRWVLHILLLLATFFTTTLVGTHMQANFLNHLPVFGIDDDLGSFVKSIVLQPSILLLGLPFSLTLMFILLAHEMGHYLYARHYHVYATLPFFIPFPSLIGTLGAFIRIKSPIPSRAALFDIGIAGPIAGFIPACVSLFAGLGLSRPIVGNPPSDFQLGYPLAFHLAARVLHLGVPLSSLSLHPIAAAAWIGFFATALNLLPGGQLDGGHIVFSVMPGFHRWISLLTIVAMVPLGKYFWTGWLVWAMLLFMTGRHPVVPRYPEVTGRRRAVAVFGLLMLVLSFTATPFTHSSGREVWPGIRDDAHDAVRSLSNGAQQFLHRKQ